MTKNKNILVISVLVILAIIVIAIILNNSKVAVAPANTTNTGDNTNTTVNTGGNANGNTNTANNTNSGTTAKTSYSAIEVAAHKTASDCWSIVNGNVYNLTSWINQHPGGSEAIISMCGIDASSEFNDQHEGQKRPANELAGFIIGSVR